MAPLFGVACLRPARQHCPDSGCLSVANTNNRTPVRSDQKDHKCSNIGASFTEASLW